MKGGTYIEVAFSTEARSRARVSPFFMALSVASKMAYPATVSARMKTMVFYLNDSLLIGEKLT